VEPTNDWAQVCICASMYAQVCTCRSYMSGCCTCMHASHLRLATASNTGRGTICPHPECQHHALLMPQCRNWTQEGAYARSSGPDATSLYRTTRALSLCTGTQLFLLMIPAEAALKRCVLLHVHGKQTKNCACTCAQVRHEATGAIRWFPGVPAGAARASGGVSLSAAAVVCRSACGAMLQRAVGDLIICVHYWVLSFLQFSPVAKGSGYRSSQVPF
jgi:hypothetical protein